MSNDAKSPLQMELFDEEESHLTERVDEAVDAAECGCGCAACRAWTTQDPVGVVCGPDDCVAAPMERARGLAAAAAAVQPEPDEWWSGLLAEEG